MVLLTASICSEHVVGLFLRFVCKTAATKEVSLRGLRARGTTACVCRGGDMRACASAAVAVCACRGGGVVAVPVPRLRACRLQEPAATGLQFRARELLRIADGALAVALKRFGELGVNREVLGH